MTNVSGTVPSPTGCAVVVMRTFPACRESSRECCTTIGASETITDE